MTVARRQTIAMVLVVGLPLCVAVLTAVGLRQMETVERNVSEEYGEVRLLQPIDRDLSVSLAALSGAGEGEQAQSAARGHLQRAEAGLVEYLATQYDDIGGEHHQAVESGLASSILTDLQALLREPGGGEALAPRVAELHRRLGDLQAAADSSVRNAHGAAQRARNGTLYRVVTASLVSTLASVALIVWSTRSVNRRLRDLHRRLAEANPGAPAAPAPGLCGVVSQIEQLNSQMIQQIEEKGRELLRRERLVGIGLLAADVAHEINNPMNAMLGLSELGLRAVERGPIDEPTRAELAESMRVVRREALRCKGVVERLMTMVRSDRKPSWFDATQLVRETVQVARAARPDRAGCFATAGDNLSVRAFGPANDVRQILLTLLINAADAVGPEGHIEADATQTGREVWLRVRDNGRGFTESMRQDFFVPFRSYSTDGKGTGLGLSIAQALAEGMGAALRPFSDGPGRGSMFVLAIPARGDAA